MSADFELTAQAIEDLDAIWWFIAVDSRDAADRVEREIVAAGRRLAKYPLIGTKRRDITDLAVRFWPVTRSPKLRDRIPRRYRTVTSYRRSARQTPDRGSSQGPVLIAELAHNALIPTHEIR